MLRLALACIAARGTAAMPRRVAPVADDGHDVLGLQATGEDFPQGFLEQVCLPEFSSGEAYLLQGGLLFFGEVPWVFSRE